MIHLTARSRSLISLSGLLATLAVFLFATTVRVPSRLRENPWLSVLKKYCGRDMDEESEDQLNQLSNALRQLDLSREIPPPMSEDQHGLHLRTQRVWQVGRDSVQSGYLVFDRNHQKLHPGTTWIQLTLFDLAGAIQAKSEFSTGWRLYLSSAGVEQHAGIEFPVIALEIYFGRTRQFYTLIDDRFDLIRLEGSDGTATSNRYYVNHFRCGPRPPQQSAEQWESDLVSGERARVLRALVWLGGHHALPLKEGEKRDHQYEDYVQAELARRVRARTGVVARLKELADRGDKWEREAAQLTLTQPLDL
jgi:hypothetical protein